MTRDPVRRHRYGKDRTNVTAGDGTKRGFRELMNDQDQRANAGSAAEFTEAAPARRADEPPTTPVPTQSAALEVDAAVTGHRDEPAAPVTRPVPVVGPAQPVATTSAWQDLANRRPGAMARERAVALKDAAPVRTFVARMLGAHTDERAWRIGADGEEKVAAQLTKLARKDPRWRFLHAIPVGRHGSDIDHLVIGPAGVYTLNAKHHPGSKVWVAGNTLMVNGQPWPYIRNSRYEAERATRLLTAACGFPVFVTGMVVPVGAADITIRTPPRDVHVVNRMRLARWLRERPATLTEAQVDRIFDTARRSTTWQPRH